ncbi:MAG: T9SS type A sorting domain-containing protein [Bacteroidota bacterium]|nr:T9SS type A sorting domain-containing protein [Bacteroidota bacterium]MDP4258934.1 T9SS type A sorting domain-containing protein [Bacteroidota bacterium]
MKRFIGLTSLLLFGWLAMYAQPSDTTIGSGPALIQMRPAGESKFFAHFSAVVKESNKVLLQWSVDSLGQGDYFIVERATEGGQYETIGAMREENLSGEYELTDIAPPNGTDLYRIKFMGEDGRLIYSKVIEVSLSSAVDFKFYPNPADKLLIIRTEHVVDIQVIDAIGSIRLAARLQPGIQVVNLSGLEKGVYILRVADKESNRIVSNQLLKN